MAKASWDSSIPVSGSNLSSYNMRNVLQSLAQGDSEPLRPRAQASPDMTVAVAGTEVENYYHRVYNDYTEPLEFATQNSSTVVAPVSNNRIDILVVSGTTASGTLHWVTGAEAASPSLPSIPQEMLPVCAIYCKTTMDRILNYEEKDTDTTEGYIYKDLRPKVVVGPTIRNSNLLWETDGGDAELKTADDIDMQTKKLKNLVAGSAAADSIRYDQAMKSGDAAGGDLTGTYPNPTIGDHKIPKVIFTWSGVDEYTANVHGAYIGTTLSPDVDGNTLSGYHILAVHGNTYETILKFRFRKVSNISSIRIEARIWADTVGAGDEAYLNVDIGGNSGEVHSVTSVTPTWVATANINVSGLTNGTVYDGIVQLKSEGTTGEAYCSAVTLMGN